MNVKSHNEVVGTDAGYRWHSRNQTPCCDACRAAHNARIQRWRDSRHPEQATIVLPLLDLVRLLAGVPAGHVAAILTPETAARVAHLQHLTDK